ncbi:MAG: FG-GAP repeat domain-containing protein [Planctomycetaceae bacterium]
MSTAKHISGRTPVSQVVCPGDEGIVGEGSATPPRSGLSGRSEWVRGTLDRAVVTLVLGWLLASLSRGASAWAAELTFSSKTLDPKAGEVVYAVIAADVDGDRRPDVVAVTENRVVWYQNPDWTPRVIVADQVERDHVCIAPLDLDGDGQLEFALGAGWLNNRHLGSLYWLKRRESLDQPWQAHRLGEESWTHRIRFGDLLGTGTPQLVVSPLNKSVATGARLLAFQVPSRESLKNPWQATPIDTSLNAIHAHWVGDLDGDQHSDMVTASQEGVHWFRRGTGGQFSKTLISRGLPGDPPTAQKTGAGEIRPGRLRDGRRILATVEPMHGTHVVLYISPAGFPVGESLSGTWQRLVLDDSLVRGHAIWPADLDGDGQDEIVVGHSDKGTGTQPGPGVFVYRGDETGQTWVKQSVDAGGIACEDLVVEDFTGDGRPDIAAGGRATHNVRLYINGGKQ